MYRSRELSNLVQTYNRLLKYLRKNIANGRFYHWSTPKKEYFISRLLQLIQRIRQNGVKVAAALSFSLLSLVAANAQLDAPFTNELCEVSPFDDIEIVDIEPEEFFARQVLTGDLDNDGDEDFVVITFEDDVYFLQYFDNTGDGFEELTGEDNPLDIFNNGGEFNGPPFLKFSLGDATLNGRLDLVLGDFKGQVLCFQNTENGFEEPAQKEFEGLEESDYASVIFGNIDDDCDIEMVAIQSFWEGEDTKEIKVYDIVNGSYQESEGMLSMFEEVTDDDSFLLVPYFFDIDGDGLDELLTTSLKEDDEFFQTQLFVKEDGVYVAVDDEDNPFFEAFSIQNEYQNLLFDFGDLDGDGLLNLYIGFKDNAFENPEYEDGLYCFDSTIDADVACVETAIPTMGQWGVFILSLLIMIFAVVGISEQRTRKLLGKPN